MVKPNKSSKSDSSRVESTVKDTAQLLEKCAAVYANVAKALGKEVDGDLIERNLRDAARYVARSANISLEYTRGSEQGAESLETLKGLYDLNPAPKNINSDGDVVLETDALIMKEMERAGIRGASDLVYRLPISATLCGQSIDVSGFAAQEARYVLTDEEVTPPPELVV